MIGYLVNTSYPAMPVYFYIKKFSYFAVMDCGSVIFTRLLQFATS